MPNYKLQKKHRSSRRVEVRAERIDIHGPALLICALLAFFIWLYIVGLSHLSAEVDNPSATPEQTTTEQESAVSALTPAAAQEEALTLFFDASCLA